MPLVLYEKKDHINYITLNRPEKLNALNTSLSEELQRAWFTCRDDNDAWVAIDYNGREKAHAK